TVALDPSFEASKEVLPNKKAFYQKEAQYQLLEKALRSLKKEQENCIRLFYYEHKSYKEIVATTSYSLKQVKSFIQNGRRNIKVFKEKKKDEKTGRHIERDGLSERTADAGLYQRQTGS